MIIDIAGYLRFFDAVTGGRSQIDAYAGLQGWPVPDIFNRSAERIATLHAGERVRHDRALEAP